MLPLPLLLLRGCRDRSGWPSRARARAHPRKARTQAGSYARPRRVTRAAVSSLASRSPWQRFPLTSIWSLFLLKRVAFSVLSLTYSLASDNRC